MQKSEEKLAQEVQGKICCLHLVNAEISPLISQVLLWPSEVTYLFRSNRRYVLALV